MLSAFCPRLSIWGYDVKIDVSENVAARYAEAVQAMVISTEVLRVSSGCCIWEDLRKCGGVYKESFRWTVHSSEPK